MDGRKPPRVCHVPHPYALSGYAALSSDGGPGPHPAPRLDSLRHRPRCLPPQAHDARGTRARLRLDLPAPVLARLDLAPPSRAVARGPALSCDVLPLQAFEPVLAFADQARPGEPGVEAAGRDDALATRALSS